MKLANTYSQFLADVDSGALYDLTPPKSLDSRTKKLFPKTTRIVCDGVLFQELIRNYDDVIDLLLLMGEAAAEKHARFATTIQIPVSRYTPEGIFSHITLTEMKAKLYDNRYGVIFLGFPSTKES